MTDIVKLIHSRDDLAHPHSKQSLRLWLKLLDCTNLIEKKIKTKLSDEFAFTLPRFDVMAALDRYPDGLTMSELSKKLMVSNGNVTGVVARLEADGYIKRHNQAKDRRTFIVKLTAKGRKTFRKMAGVHEEWVDSLFSNLSNDEIEELMHLLDLTKTSADENSKSESLS